MPELRQNFFTKEWVIIATERAKRPEELAMHHPPKVVPPFVATCPFCPGNETKTPPEVLRVPVDLVQPWTVRVVPNKFAALSPTLQPTRTIHRSRRSISGFGVHDVIIETPDHSQVTALLPHLDIANILRAYKSRHDALSHDARIAQVTIFKNHGKDAGTSLEHPHSQLIATPVISNQVRQRLQQALRHYDEFGECMFCQMIEEELEARNIRYALLTGETRDRSAQVAAFQQGAVPIFLISLKAGGVGLNLTAADTVIHYDPWWNPAAENQATDRAWRIGQDKPVFVYKLIAKGTLEEKIQLLQQKKSELANSILAEGESQKMALTQEDLQAIFAPLEE